MEKVYYSLFIILSFFIISSCSTESTPVFQLNTSADPVEAGTVTPSKGEYEEGEQVEITASPNEHWVFEAWQGDHTDNSNPINITINSDTDVTAIFTKREYPLSVNTEGEGSVGERIVQAKSTDYPHGTTVELTANPIDDWIFTGWSGDLTGNENPQTIIVEGETNVTATFESVDILLNIEIDGDGDIELDQEDSSENPSRSNIQITAVPSAGWKFVEWNGDLTGGENPQTLTLDEKKEVQALFEREEFSVNISLEGDGNISITPEKETYFGGDVISISVTPEDGWSFVFWDGDLEGTDNPIEITLDQDISATANLDKNPFAGGNGSEMYPYQVSNIDQLQEIKNFTDSHFIQINNIDASETKNWNGGDGFDPIGDDIVKFRGTYNGDNFEISNLYIERKEQGNVSLFGVVDNTTIENITVSNADITGSSYTAILVSDFDGDIAKDNKLINCSVSGKVTGSVYTGGLIGFARHGNIFNCQANATVFGGRNTGGLVGVAQVFIRIENSEANGEVKGTISVGGLIGSISGATIFKTKATGNVTGTFSVGGLIGNNYSQFFRERGIRYSYAEGNVKGEENVGGLVGLNRGAILASYAKGDVVGVNKVGGLAGINTEFNQGIGHIKSSYSIGSVEGETNFGGFIGTNGNQVENSFFDTETSGKSNSVGRGISDGVIGLTTTKMTSSSAEEYMPEFDWEEVWKTVQNDYPILQWQEE